MIIKKTKKIAANATEGRGADSQKLSKEEEQKIDSLKTIIEEAEKSLFSARAMLTRLEGQNKPAVQKKTYGASPDGKVIEGVFDGQLMIGNDGKQYPVPANYASKSKLVEGDMLKLTITDDGNFIYKQIGPVDRRRQIGLVEEDEAGNFIISSEGRKFKVLLASVTYYKAHPGDEVTIVLPKSGEPIWCSIENVTKRSAFGEMSSATLASKPAAAEEVEDDLDRQDPFMKSEEEKSENSKNMSQIVDEWTPNASEMEKEAGVSKEEDASEATDSSEGAKIKIKVGAEDSDDNNDQIVKKDFPDTPQEFFS